MAFIASDITAEPRSFSQGPVKIQLMKWTAVSGDTSGTITADQLIRISHVIMDGGLVLTAAPTYATNVATLAFTNPLANAFGNVICVGV